MDSLLHRIEALPGDGRYALTFRRPDGGEQTAVAQIVDDAVQIADSSLPAGWYIGSDEFDAAGRALLALHDSRRPVERGAMVRDVDGGWDVGLGNVVLGPQGCPECTAHGSMTEDAGIWMCAECGARAVLS